MDKRGDILLRRAWDSSIVSLKPALAPTCVVRNLELWLSQIQTRFTSHFCFRGVGFPSDSSKSVRTANSARRRPWLKTWSDPSSKLRLCGLLLSGDHLFGPGLQEALAATADRKM